MGSQKEAAHYFLIKNPAKPNGYGRTNLTLTKLYL